MLRKRRKGQHGQVLVIFAIFMALLFFTVIAFVADLSVLYSASTKAHSAALVAAETGVDDLDLNSLAQGGGIKLAGNALAACSANGNSILRLPAYGNNNQVTCQKTGSNSQITATAKITVILPVPIFGRSTVVTAQETACPVYGTSVAIQAAC